MINDAPDLAQITRESRSSIEVHRDAKGIYSYTIKRYQGNPFDIDAILDDIELVDEALRLKYTPSDPNLATPLRLSIDELRRRREARVAEEES